MSLSGSVLFITGGSRGIGLEIAKRAASDGASITVVAETDQEHPNLPGSLAESVAELQDLGARALGLVADVRDEAQVDAAVAKTVETFGGIDICVNNASAINRSSVADLSVKRYDLMQDVNARGTFVVSKACLPYLRSSDNAHILTLSPPLNLDPKWLAAHPAYTLSKYGMTILTLGLAGELSSAGIAANTLWARTLIGTAAVKNILGGDAAVARAMKPQIMADAAYEILQRDASTTTGNCYIDDEVLAEAGITDFSRYRISQSGDLLLDIFVDDWGPIGATASVAPA